MMTSNKYYRHRDKDIFIKVGKVENQSSTATLVAQVIDYCGSDFHSYLSASCITLDDMWYLQISYNHSEHFAEVDEDYFYKQLADKMIYFVVERNFNKPPDYQLLNFKMNDERRYLLLRLKIPMIIKETIA